MSSFHFQAKIEIYNGNPYVLVNKQRAATLKHGWRKPLPVLAQINGEPKSPWRINMMPIGDGSFYLYLHGAVRKASNTRVGDRVAVDMSFDVAYKNGPMHPMPEWFRVPLSRNKEAQQAWNTLIPSRKKEILRYFSWLKSEEARERNVKRHSMFFLEMKAVLWRGRGKKGNEKERLWPQSSSHTFLTTERPKNITSA